MSNALYSAWVGQLVGQATAGAAQAAGAPATTPASAPARAMTTSESVMLGLVGVGVVVLGVWIIRCFARPKRLKLLHTPGRPNNVNIIHIAVVLIAWMAAQGLAVQWLGPVFAEPGAATQPAATQPAATPPAATAPAGTQPAATHPAKAEEHKEVDPRLSQAVAAVTMLIWLAGGLVVASATFRHGLIRGLGLSPRHWMCDAARGLVAYFAVLPLCVGLFLLSQGVSGWLGYPTKLHPTLQQFTSLAPGWRLLAVVNAVVLAPLAEEVFFRGLLQSALRRWLRAPRAGILIVSAIFAWAHAGAEPQAVASLFVLGLALGYNYERTGRLISPILTHAVFNAVALLLTG